MRFLLPIAFTIVLCCSCTEKETVYVNNHENVLVDGNMVPPYSEVTTVQIQNYINKLYIDLLAREPDFIELDNTTTFLKNNDLSPSARTQLVNNLLERDEYFDRLWEVYRRAYLNGATNQEIEVRLFLFTQEYEIVVQNPEPFAQALAAAYLLEIEKLELLLAAPEAYADGTITIDEYLQRIAYNNIYDQINMGAENMVLSCFENFLKRLPTEAERNAGVRMINGESSQLLLQDGNDKLEFVQIVTSTPEFYEGLSRDVYQQLLLRDPTSEEMSTITAQLTNDKDFEGIQLQIAISDEYAGF